MFRRQIRMSRSWFAWSEPLVSRACRNGINIAPVAAICYRPRSRHLSVIFATSSRAFLVTADSIRQGIFPRLRSIAGRMAIANSDAGAAAYTDQAMDQAWRAVEELHSA